MQQRFFNSANYAFVITGGLVIATALFACGSHEEDFPVAVGNRTGNTLKVFANGREIGDVSPAQTGSFIVRIAPTDQRTTATSATSPISPTPAVEVKFSAKDLATGALSRECLQTQTIQGGCNPLTLFQDHTTYVEFNPADFPVTAAAMPVANFTFSPAAPGINQDVFFNASSSSASGGRVTVTWDFGDGGSASGITVTHQYARAGTFTVTLRVTDVLGQADTASKVLTVSSNSAQIVADFTFSPLDPVISRGTNTVFFDATPSSAEVTTWTWDFGDGSAGAGQHPSHTYLRAGTWVVRLTVTDMAGRMATSTKNVTVRGSPPIEVTDMAGRTVTSAKNITVN